MKFFNKFSRFPLVILLIFLLAFSSSLAIMMISIAHADGPEGNPEGSDPMSQSDPILVLIDGEPVGVFNGLEYRFITGEVDVNLAPPIWLTCQIDRVFRDRFEHLPDNSPRMTLIIDGEALGTLRRLEYLIAEREIHLFSAEGLFCSAT